MIQTHYLLAIPDESRGWLYLDGQGEWTFDARHATHLASRESAQRALLVYPSATIVEIVVSTLKPQNNERN